MLHGVYSKIYQEIVHDQVRMPSLPEAGARIQLALENPEICQHKIARIIQTDPALTAYLIKMANSSFYRRWSPAKTAFAAVRSLGAKQVKHLAIVFTLRNSFKAKSPVIQSIMNELWHESAKVAAISYVLASRCKGFKPDQALLAGLLRNIGVLPLLHQLDEKYQLIEINHVYSMLEKYAPLIGINVLQHWKLGDDVVAVAREAGNWFRDDKKSLDLADLVNIATIHAFMGTSKFKSVPRIMDIPAYDKLPFMQLTPENSLSILQEADDEIREIQELLDS